jgi:hypothetical protein
VADLVNQLDVGAGLPCDLLLDLRQAASDYFEDFLRSESRAQLQD